jgi:hypothetical protein
MNSYALRWTMAVALKQGYPLVRETGAADPEPPPQPTAAELYPAIKSEQWKMAAYGAAGGLVVGGLIGILIHPRRGRAHA